jgi:3-deoxy-D-manno-octulosonic-acid transferase
VPQFLYDFLVKTYGFLIGIYSLFNRKAALWVSGRKDWERTMSLTLDGLIAERIWIHAASLGEFEQGRPLIEALRTKYPEKGLVLTFFSPSGFEIRKDYKGVDAVLYLPLDTRHNAKVFLDLLKPELAVFIKYEFWFNHLAELKKRDIKTILVSGRLHAKQGFFKPWGKFFRKGLETFGHFFLQNKGSAELLEDIGFKNYTVNGDTRFDRVMSVREENKDLPEIESFTKESKVIMLGSSWPYEEILLNQFMIDYGKEDFKVVIAPHELDERRMREFIEKCPLNCLLLSQWNLRNGDERVLIIDRIGMLSQAYRYGDIALVGGGFGAGIHNVLEPAVWGIPVVFGPRYEMFSEAVELVERDAAFSAEDQKEFNELLLELLNSEDKRTMAGQKALEYCRANQGATKAVMDYISDDLR